MLTMQQGLDDLVWRTLIVDNFDSYTHNLFHLVAAVTKVEPIVIRNTDHELYCRLKEADAFDVVILSPGPGRPERDADFGICKMILELADRPVFGVCLGCQGLGWLYGLSVQLNPDGPAHGCIAQIFHNEHPLFGGVPQGFNVVRYHSLCLETVDGDQRFPEQLEKLAWTENGIVMAIGHRTKPLWGVQFHPESICSENGLELVRNFLSLSLAWYRDQSSGSLNRFAAREAAPQCNLAPLRAGSADSIPPAMPDHRKLSIQFRKIEEAPDAETVYYALLEHDPHSFWLDSARRPHPSSRFSYMGPSDGPLSHHLSYSVDSRSLLLSSPHSPTHNRVLHGIDLLEYIKQQLEMNKCDNEELPFEFKCGYVGYLGYEIKSLCEDGLGLPNKHASPHPDAQLLFADRLIVFDHGLPPSPSTPSPGGALGSRGPGGLVQATGGVGQSPAATGHSPGAPGNVGHAPRGVALSPGGGGGGGGSGGGGGGGGVAYLVTLVDQSSPACVAQAQAWLSATAARLIALLPPCSIPPCAAPALACIVKEEEERMEQGEVREGAGEAEQREGRECKEREEEEEEEEGMTAGPGAEDDGAVQGTREQGHNKATKWWQPEHSDERGYPETAKESGTQEEEEEGNTAPGAEEDRAVLDDSPCGPGSLSFAPTAPAAPLSDAGRPDSPPRGVLLSAAESPHHDFQPHPAAAPAAAGVMRRKAAQQLDHASSAQGGVHAAAAAADAHAAAVSAALVACGGQGADRKARGHMTEGAERIEEFQCRVTEEEYMDKVSACHEWIRQGEAYEICLTTRLVSPSSFDPAAALAFYRRLRRVNPAPFGAVIRCGAGLTVCSSSPERFLRVSVSSPDAPSPSCHTPSSEAGPSPTRRGLRIESKPIKGTRRRGATPEEDAELVEELGRSVKDRQENLMIVDLVRNDLGRVCGAASVSVPELFKIESYASVHQMVSKVEGELKEGLGPVEAIRAAFPMGSMTGAPKPRVLSLIDELEGEARGVYSGTIGYLSLHGPADLSVAIRVALLDPTAARIGAGGAIIALSDPREEWHEMRLKAAAVTTAAAPLP